MVVLGICIFICCKKKFLEEYLGVELLHDGVCVYLTFLNCDKYFQRGYSILCSTKSSDNLIVHCSWCCLLLKLVFYMVSLGVSPFQNVSFNMSVCSVCLWVCVYLFVCVYGLHVYGHVCVMAHLWKSVGNVLYLPLSFHHVDSQTLTQTFRFSSQSGYSLNNFTCPYVIVILPHYIFYIKLLCNLLVQASVYMFDTHLQIFIFCDQHIFLLNLLFRRLPFFFIYFWEFHPFVWSFE